MPTTIDREEDLILGRRLNLCPALIDRPLPELVQECPQCNDFLLHCCACNNQLLDLPRSHRPAQPCYHYHIIFIDGACTNNGKPAAKAGVGVAYGNDDSSQMSKPITNTVGSFPLRSNQRVELYAAKSGLEFFSEAHDKDPKSDTKAWIIATDSEYVIKGMTEWLPRWKRNDWRTTQGSKPANSDLFLALDGILTKHEAENVKVGWVLAHSREHNKIADRLAKAAAVFSDEARNEARV
ncbi:hypothetical protein COCC4DRAFT_82768 [Bipolaris maydis ATCC 48331]|uniref:ribonuclease H n=2 Tax=Cochliobolus heterostrophus TaxID=5016 RepID=M2UFA1_COCH5|nr:uncharacterized protein COCC4DRAFT_82768 [Bipolaris maydis ATCC 48331]EMD86688.1 hypothetical protein COCHEDRAFT_1218244 [Bipolaris maydis C5]KAJ5042656.1 ribonuclease H-like domain-containing protein [Bipolaris maydis]ENI03084.1 hypothetical protein COCC4DRAFT_82768 [Bipolaris maydis ATCC 48331]KAJ5052575.1 ribonuclease H-like domain-containing protein [Bipolaris maydis]KAJ6192251.1 ribonuclease H-like domain-containing protein [Bipolaris maydis]